MRGEQKTPGGDTQGTGESGRGLKTGRQEDRMVKHQHTQSKHKEGRCKTQGDTDHERWI